jgi:hypothetical protein
VTRVERLCRRWGLWPFVLLSLVFWLLLWPVGVAWLVAAAIRRYRRLDKSPPARTARRIERFLSWYPAEWRARYGQELEQLLHDTIESGHGGARLTLNMVRESAAAQRIAPRPAAPSARSVGRCAGSRSYPKAWSPSS